MNPLLSGGASHRRGKGRDEYFDEKYFAYYEDVDLAWRAKLRGWKSLYAPEAVAYHRRRGKAIKDTPLFSRAMANLYLTYLKNESGIGLIFLCLFKMPREIGRIFFRIIFRGKASYGRGVLESIRLGKMDLAETLRKRRLIQERRLRRLF
jgi:GT2 family glycosyltransferase